MSSWAPIFDGMQSVAEARETQRKSWNRTAPAWMKWDAVVLAMQQPIGTVMLERVALRSGDRVLDVAAGTGEPGLTAAARVAPGRVVGTDVSDELVAAACENARARGLDNYEGQAAEASDLPFPDASFEVVLCRLGIMFFPDPALALREMARVLVPGGRISIACWGPREKNDWMTNVMGPAAEILGLPPPPPDAFREPDTLRKLLEQAGIEDVTQEAVDYEYTFESPERYFECVSDLAPPLVAARTTQSPEKLAALENGVLTALRKIARKEAVRVGCSAWVASGTKGS